jgi:hypothetical protein
LAGIFENSNEIVNLDYSLKSDSWAVIPFVLCCCDVLNEKYLLSTLIKSKDAPDMAIIIRQIICLKRILLLEDYKSQLAKFYCLLLLWINVWVWFKHFCCLKITKIACSEKETSLQLLGSGVHLSWRGRVVNAPRITDKITDTDQLFKSNLTFCVVRVLLCK